MGDGKSGLQLRSLLKKSGELELSLVNIPTPEPGEDEVVVRVEAAALDNVLLSVNDRTAEKCDELALADEEREDVITRTNRVVIGEYTVHVFMIGLFTGTIVTAFIAIGVVLWKHHG